MTTKPPSVLTINSIILDPFTAPLADRFVESPKKPRRFVLPWLPPKGKSCSGNGYMATHIEVCRHHFELVRPIKHNYMGKMHVYCAISSTASAMPDNAFRDNPLVSEMPITSFSRCMNATKFAYVWGSDKSSPYF